MAQTRTNAIAAYFEERGAEEGRDVDTGVAVMLYLMADVTVAYLPLDKVVCALRLVAVT